MNQLWGLSNSSYNFILKSDVLSAFPSNNQFSLTPQYFLSLLLHYKDDSRFKIFTVTVQPQQHSEDSPGWQTEWKE